MTNLMNIPLLDDENEILVNQIYHHAKKLANELQQSDRSKEKISARCEAIIFITKMIKEYEGE